MQKYSIILLSLILIGCASGKATHVEPMFDDNGAYIGNMTTSVEESNLLWGKQAISHKISAKQTGKNKWDVKAGQEANTEMGNAQEVMSGLVEMFQLGVKVGAGIPGMP